MNIFVTGIDTNVGKTVVCAILMDILKADYWKPIQAGNLDFTDKDSIKTIVSNNQSNFHESSYDLQRAMSPHAAASLEKKYIDINKIILPNTDNKHIIIEGAGGILVPINDDQTILDIMDISYGVILVSSYYLGSINHTLMSIDILKRNNKNILGIVFNGKENKSSKDIIIKKTKLPILLEVPKFDNVDKQTIFRYAMENKGRIKGLKL